MADAIIEEIRAAFGPEELIVQSSDIAEGDSVRIVGGAFHDLLAVVKEVMPAKNRISALLEFLGRATKVELDLCNVVLDESSRTSRRDRLVSNP